MSWDWISDRQIPYGAISSVILIVTVLVVKKLLLRAVLRLDSQQPEVRRRWVVNIRNAALVALMIGLIMIWATPLRTLAGFLHRTGRGRGDRNQGTDSVCQRFSRAGDQ